MLKTFLFVMIFTSAQMLAQETYKVACVGNSITQGFGNTNSNSYPNRLDVILGDKYDVRNFGVGGTTLLKNGDKPYWDESAFDNATQFEPDIVIILLGTNDSKPQNWAFKDEFYGDYVDLINHFRSLKSEPQIFIGYPPPVFQVLAGINNPVVRDEIIPIIDSLKSSMNTFWINFYEALDGKSNLFPDGVHLNEEGYLEMANIAADALLNKPSGVIDYFFAMPTTVEEGESTTLFWRTSDSSTVTLNGNLVNPSDSLQVSPIQSETYTLISSGVFNDTVSLQVDFLPSGFIKYFHADPPILESGINAESTLRWSASKNSISKINGESVAFTDSFIVTPTETTSYELITTGTISDSALIQIQVLESELINRSLLAKSFQVSTSAYQFLPEWVADSDTSTFWQSNRSTTEWLVIDLGKEININRIQLIWGDVYAKTFHLQIMNESNSTLPFFSNSNGAGGVEDITREYVKGRYIRLLCVSSVSSTEGYQVKEIEVYGTEKKITGFEWNNSIELNRYQLQQNFPNPFNPSTEIKFNIPNDQHVKITLFDVLGRQIRILINKKFSTGFHSFNFSSYELTSGIYFYRMEAGEFTSTKKMVLMR